MTTQRMTELIGATEDEIHAEWDGKTFEEIERDVNAMWPNESRDGNKELAQAIFDFVE